MKLRMEFRKVFELGCDIHPGPRICHRPMAITTSISQALRPRRMAPTDPMRTGIQERDNRGNVQGKIKQTGTLRGREARLHKVCGGTVLCMHAPAKRGKPHRCWVS